MDIWKHCQEVVERTIAESIEWYVGITGALSERRDKHEMKGWENMVVIHIARTSKVTAALEDRIIKAYSHRAGCQNQTDSGGQGASDRQPHCLYLLSNSKEFCAPRLWRTGGARAPKDFGDVLAYSRKHFGPGMKW